MNRVGKRNLFCAPGRNLPHLSCHCRNTRVGHRLAASPTGSASLRLAQNHKHLPWSMSVFVVTSNFFAVAQKFSRPRLAVRPARLTTLRLAQDHKHLPKGKCLCVLCSRQESNLHYILRKDASYPLNDGSIEDESILDLCVNPAEMPGNYFVSAPTCLEMRDFMRAAVLGLIVPFLAALSIA
ncbi:MAG: hypothetical protein Athens041674_297 [Parcubacteria group bacterium Athens0416_74]|nr:MAG: hypothetical protein Athens041674_297 [Parcubacteria group bacterium Athens0416_74]